MGASIILPYSLLIGAIFVGCVREILHQTHEIITLSKEIIKLEEQHNLLVNELIKKQSQAVEAVNITHNTNTYFYVFVGVCVVLVLTAGYVYLSSGASEEVAEVIAKYIPEISKVSTEATLGAVQSTSEIVSDKLHGIDVNIEKLGKLTEDIGVKCISLDYKVNLLVDKILGVEAEIAPEVARLVIEGGLV